MSDNTKIENPSSELPDEALGAVNGGIKRVRGLERSTYCSRCGKDVTPDDDGCCPNCGKQL